MKKTTKTVKTPAPATKLTAPAPARKSTIAPKIKQAAAASLAAPAIMAKPKAAGVTITAKVDVGFGNTLFLRGNGAGLNWSKGTPLACVSSDTWRVVLPRADSPFAFKFVLNDTAWSAGKDYLAGPGDTVTVTPAF
jgi:hypothetical protein